MSVLRPDLLRYLDYRTWLKDMVEYLRVEKGKSVRRISLEADFGSSSFLGMIIQGKRHLGPQGIKKLEKVFELESGEKSFLIKLIAFSSAKELEEKDRCYRGLLSELKRNKIRLLQASEYEFFSRWYHVAVLEALPTPWGLKTIKAQANHLGISVDELQESYRILLQLGLVKKADEKWIRTQENLVTTSETQSVLIRQFHRQMLERAGKSLHEDEAKDRFNGALTIPISSRDYERLRKRLEELQKEIHLEYSDSKDPDQVVQFNLQLFSLVRSEDVSESKE